MSYHVFVYGFELEVVSEVGAAQHLKSPELLPDMSARTEPEAQALVEPPQALPKPPQNSSVLSRNWALAGIAVLISALFYRAYSR